LAKHQPYREKHASLNEAYYILLVDDDRELGNLIIQVGRGGYGTPLHLLDHYFLRRYGYRAIVVQGIVNQLHRVSVVDRVLVPNCSILHFWKE
jgi:hypothetical protein